MLDQEHELITKFKKEVSGLILTAYRAGMVEGSGAEYFADGKVFTATELANQHVQHDMEAARLLEEIGKELSGSRDV